MRIYTLVDNHYFDIVSMRNIQYRGDWGAELMG